MLEQQHHDFAASNEPHITVRWAPLVLLAKQQLLQQFAFWPNTFFLLLLTSDEKNLHCRICQTALETTNIFSFLPKIFLLEFILGYFYICGIFLGIFLNIFGIYSRIFILFFARNFFGIYLYFWNFF